MNSSVVSARSRGILALASNTDTVDYVSIATQTLALAGRQLGIEHRVIELAAPLGWKNSRKDVDTNTMVSWNNHSRWSVYQHSPWDETIVIDADYLVMTDSLNLLFASQADYLLCSNNIMQDNELPQCGLPDTWGTVLFFRKTEKSQCFFELLQRIERNYHYYRAMFSVRDRNYRNDYAMAMADLIINAQQTHAGTRMPWSIVTIEHEVTDIDANGDWIVVRGLDRADIFPRRDLHVMSKSWLQGPGLARLIGVA